MSITKIQQMLQLYYAPDNASLMLRLALEEAAQPYEAILVDRAAQAQKTPAYLRLNPVGQIPTLVTPDGPIAESGACLLWISDTYRQNALGPSPDQPTRGTFLRWLFYISNTLHADLIRIFYPERFVTAEVKAQHHDHMVRRLVSHYEILEAAIKDEPAVFEPPSVLSLYLCPLMRWSVLYPKHADAWFDISMYPTLKRLAQTVEQRQSAKSAAIAEGLGHAPFSEPELPRPPEGSAT
ncbi:MAG: glutathione S-transferase family protein [Pseudomonadota bacterium]